MRNALSLRGLLVILLLTVGFGINLSAQTASPVAYVPRLGPGASGSFEIARFDLATNLPLSPIPTAFGSWSAAYSRDGKLVCVSFPNNNSVEVYDAASGTRVQTIPTGVLPRDITNVMIAGQEHWAVANQGDPFNSIPGSVSFISVSSLTVASTLDLSLSGVSQPTVLAPSADGKTLIGGTKESAANLFFVDLTQQPPVVTRVVPIRDAAGRPTADPRALVPTSDGARVYVTSLAANTYGVPPLASFDLATGVTKYLDTGNVSAAGAVLTDTKLVVANFSLGSISIFDTATDVRLAIIAISTQSVSGVTSFGGIVYVAALDDFVRAVDLTTGGVTATILVGSTPVSIAVPPQKPPVTFQSTTQQIQQFAQSGKIDNLGTSQSLQQQLAASQNAVASGNKTAAANILDAMANYVRAQDSKHIDPVAAQQILAAIAALKSNL